MVIILEKAIINIADIESIEHYDITPKDPYKPDEIRGRVEVKFKSGRTVVAECSNDKWEKVKAQMETYSQPLRD